MALSNEVVKEVRESLGLTIDQVAHWTGYSKTHVHAIEMGFRTPSPEFLAGLHRVALAQGDLRIVQLVEPRITGLQLLPRPQRTPPAGDPLELVMAEIEANKHQARLLEYMYRIARDGRVDESDDKAIADFLAHANELIALHQKTAAAVMTLRAAAAGK